MSGSRVKQLDVLRAVAVLMVIIHHAFYTLMDDYPLTLRLCVSAMRRAGWAGVDLFFVLSGFLISGLIFREYRKHGKFDVVRFFVRRGFKIYPSFYVFLAVTAVVVHVAGYASDFGYTETRRVLPEILFVQNYVPGLWGHTWSLAVEEHFYLATGIGLFLLSRRAKGTGNPFSYVPGVFFTSAAVVLGLRILTVLVRPGIEDWRNYYPTHLRLDSLSFGVYLSYLYNFHHEAMMSWLEKHKTAVLCVGLLLCGMSIAFRKDTVPMATVGYTILYVGFGAVMMVSLLWRPDNVTGLRRRLLDALAYTGTHSYSIYLWHLPIAIWMSIYTSRPDSGWNYYHFMLVYVSASLVLGVLISKLVEVPALALRNRLFPSRSDAL